MFKSVFAKYYAIISAIILVSFIAMQGAQLFLSSRYWAEDKHTVLSEHAASIAEHTGQRSLSILTEEGVIYRIQKITLIPFIKMLSGTLESTVVIVDTTGEILILCDDEGRDLPIREDISLSSVINSIETEYYAVSTLNGLYQTPQYTAGTPIYKEDILLGYAFVSIPMGGMWEYLFSNARIALIAALTVLTVTFIALYVMTERLVRPLRAMAGATRQFAKGDFSPRIAVNGKDEVAELANALNNMAVSLSSVEGMRRSFIANVSHELRTPMTTIAGFIDGILDGTIPRDKHKHYLSVVTVEVKRLSRLVQSMLALSRIDSGEVKLNKTEFDMTALTGQTLLSFEKRIEEKNITVDGLEEVSSILVHGDFDLMGQVLYNLLDNAVKFTNQNGRITVGLSREKGRVLCSIRNTGDGIPEEEMPHIFERFYKTDRSRSLDKNGVGLGLYIVQTVLGLHDGEVLVRSTQGEYTEFVFWLPDA